VWQWPASWATAAFNRLSGERVLLLEPQGTIWHGSAYLALAAGPGGGAPMAWPHRLHWQLSASGLTALSLRLQPEAQPQVQPWHALMQWLPSGWQVQLSDVDWRLPSAWLSGLGSPWNTVQPEGQIRLQSQNWVWRQTGLQVQSSGQFTLTLEQFATRLSSLRPLGDYRLTVLGADSVSVSLTTLQGPLHLQGHGVWQQGNLQFTGEAWAPQPQDEPALANLLGVLGPRQGTRALLKVG
jgi:general secretion pathway protein N